MELIKSVKFFALLAVMAIILPYEILRAIILTPLGKRVIPVKSWGRLTNLRVRVIRHSLSWAMKLRTQNVFDFHLAKFLHNKVDCVKIDRWVDFEHNGLLEGSDLKDEIKEEDLKGCIDALWFHPEAKYKNTNLDHVILYFHGGGYAVQFYDDPMYYPMTRRFANYAKRDILSIDYRASKEEPFPYCLQDAISAYRYLTIAKGYKPANITLGGDSAGANLALAALQYLMKRGGSEKGLAVPGRIFLVSPWTDLTVSASQGSDIKQKARTDYIPVTMGLYGASQQTGTRRDEFERRNHPYISPFFGDFSALKDTGINFHVTYGSVELLCDEQAEFIEMLKTQIGASNVDVFIAQDMVHDHQLVFPDYKISKETHEAQGEWFIEKEVQIKL